MASAYMYVGAARCAGGPLRTADQQDRSSALSEQYDLFFENRRVPQENVFAEGNGDLIIAKDFTSVRPGRRGDCRRRGGALCL